MNQQNTSAPIAENKMGYKACRQACTEHVSTHDDFHAGTGIVPIL